MKIAFLTEMGFVGSVPANHRNMRTEFAWMYALNAMHYNISSYSSVVDYDHVFIIFPKGRVFLDACGSKISNEVNPTSNLLAADILTTLKANNKKVYYVQEGPHWLYNDYELVDQINFYNILMGCDAIFAHNHSDMLYYRGITDNIPVHTIPTLMIDDLIADIIPTKEDKVIIGGNFARWYGGFESYIAAQGFDVPIWAQSSHATRVGEEQLVNHLPRVDWVDWMKYLSTFKYAVHLMPTVAAGTFSLNCAYFGIPCIGNVKVDTQIICHPKLAVEVNDVESAKQLVLLLKHDKEFYAECSKHAKAAYNSFYTIKSFINTINNVL